MFEMITNTLHKIHFIHRIPYAIIVLLVVVICGCSHSIIGDYEQVGGIMSDGGTSIRFSKNGRVTWQGYTWRMPGSYSIDNDTVTIHFDVNEELVWIGDIEDGRLVFNRALKDGKVTPTNATTVFERE